MKKTTTLKTIVLLALAIIIIDASAQEFKIRGRLHMDALVGIHEADTLNSGFNNRRARIGVDGKLNENWDGRIEVDFADATLSPNDFRLRRRFEHGGRLWIGQFKVPMGLNQLTSSNEITFMERSAISNIIADARRMGVAYELFKGQVGFKTMVYGRALGQRADIVNSNNMPIGGALRAVFAPKFGESQLHIGGSVAYEDYNENYGARYRDRPEIRDSKGGNLRFIDVNIVNAESTLKTGAELLFINGPLSIEGEFMYMSINDIAMEDNPAVNPSFYGWHIQSSYVLTGESRSYKDGSVGGISPSRETGAWEIAVRYSFMDLNDSGYTGGQQGVFTLGLNSYVTSKLRFMANVLLVDVDKLDNMMVIGGVRAQYNF